MVIVVGNGGREHALASMFEHVTVVPEGGPIPYTADLIVIGPERSLARGVADLYRRYGIPVFGPGVDGALLETSKIAAKRFMDRAGLPTARWWGGGSFEYAAAFIATIPTDLPVVVKMDGLAAGKGVLVTHNRDYALADADAKLRVGRIVVEEGLIGTERSLFAVCDGKTFAMLPIVKDYKRAFDGDRGPNTGGMGAVSTPTFGDPNDYAWIVRRTLDTLIEDGIDYRGVLYVGVMLTHDGPRILEYNVRFGDPEMQALQPRIANLADLITECADGHLRSGPEVSSDATVVVTLAASGYPDVSEMPSSIETTAATRVWWGNGGRAAYAWGVGQTVNDARLMAYDQECWPSWPGRWSRTDIAEGLL